MTTAFQAIIAILIVSHLLALAVTGFRLIHRHSTERRTGNDGLWWDDLYAAVTSCGGVYILGVLTAIALHGPALKPLEYKLAFSGYFYVMWSSRACQVMTTGRLLHFTFWPSAVSLCLSLSLIFLAVGVGYSILAVFFCVEDVACSAAARCICRMKTTLVIASLISDVIADIAIIGVNWYFLTLKNFKAPASRKVLVYAGFSSGIGTLIVNVVFWVSYQTSTPDSHVRFLSLATAVAVVSSLALNATTMVGILSRRLRLLGPIPEVPNVSASAPQEAIALQTMPVSSLTSTVTLTENTLHDKHETKPDPKEDLDSLDSTVTLEDTDSTIKRISNV